MLLTVVQAWKIQREDENELMKHERKNSKQAEEYDDNDDNRQALFIFGIKMHFL